jgi:DNA-binding XRE family transcriptional regulator
VGICDAKVKLVRTEFGFTQEKMANVLGISKKTLVEIEKDRKSLGWTTSVALCSIFNESDILSSSFGGKTTDIIFALAFEGEQPRYTKTLGGKVWWMNTHENKAFIIQQNIISQHYRLLTKDRRRVSSSFKLEDLLPLFNSEQED